MNGMSVHGGIHSIRRDVSDFLGLHAPGGAPRVRHAPARHLRLHARFHRTRRRRTDASADRTARHAAGYPGFTLIRPADASETAEAWRAALKHKGPVALVLTRQKLGFIDRTKYAAATGLAKGAYVLADSPGGAPQVVLMSTGSEVASDTRGTTEARGDRSSCTRCEHAES